MARSYYQIADEIINRLAAMAIPNGCKVELVGMLTALQTRHDLDLKQLQDEQTSVSVFDEEEIYENCTVQVLKNSITGEVSIGWWQGDGEEYEEDEM